MTPVGTPKQSRTHGDVKRADSGLHGTSTNAFANLLGTGQRGIWTAIVEHDEEFLTAVTTHKIVRAYGKEQTASNFAQNLVPDQMTVPIVDILEMAEIFDCIRRSISARRIATSMGLET